MFETVEVTNMCMICDGSRVVVIDRKKRDWPGITFPGGHIEPGESFTDAVIREVQEETGRHIPPAAFLLCDGWAAGLSPMENLWDKQKPGLLLETGWFAVYFTTVPG